MLAALVLLFGFCSVRIPLSPIPRSPPPFMDSSAQRAVSSSSVTPWSPAEMAGRLVEVCGSARLAAAFMLILAAQQKREPVAWITCAEGFFFPPDAADSGADLEALPIVRVPDAISAGRAADLLLRSGAFGLAVLDLDAHGELPMPLQSRLVGLAQKHRAGIVCLTDKSARDASLSSLVSLRVETWRKRQPDGRLLCGVRALKDKHRGPGWEHSELLRGPPGLR